MGNCYLPFSHLCVYLVKKIHTRYYRFIVIGYLMMMKSRFLVSNVPGRQHFQERQSLSRCNSFFLDVLVTQACANEVTISVCILSWTK